MAIRLLSRCGVGGMPRPPEHVTGKTGGCLGAGEGNLEHTTKFGCTSEAIAVEVKAGGLPRPPEGVAGQTDGCLEVGVGIGEHVTKFGCNADAGGCGLAGGGGTRRGGTTGKVAEGKADSDESNCSAGGGNSRAMRKASQATVV